MPGWLLQAADRIPREMLWNRFQDHESVDSLVHWNRSIRREFSLLEPTDISVIHSNLTSSVNFLQECGKALTIENCR